MTDDEQREVHIASLSLLIERAMQRWDKDGCFHARGQADGYRIAMEDLIRGRSAAQSPDGWIHAFDALPAHLKAGRPA